MQNIKYHVLNTISVTVFSFVFAATINQFIRLSITPIPSKQLKKPKTISQIATPKSFDDYKPIIDSGFFRVASPESAQGSAAVSSAISELQLLGTISGPPVIARALVKKNNQKDPEIFKLGSNVYGFNLVRIDNSKIYLKSGDKVEIMDMFGTLKPEGQKPAPPTDQSNKFKQTISKSELQQKALKNMDNALSGLRAGPHRVDGKIEGYKLFFVDPSSMLYKLGARNGDIVKRVNGHPIDSTEKLYQMWQSIQGESKITVDLDRGGKLVNYDFTLTE